MTEDVVQSEEIELRHEPGALARLWAIRYARLPILICVLFFVFALGSECYAIYCHRTNTTPIYQVQNPELRNHAPMKGHILGTDYLGRDVLLRAVFATRTAVKVGIVASLISSVVGVALGLIGGYYGGRTDAVVLWIYSTFASIPKKPKSGTSPAHGPVSGPSATPVFQS